jgi:hypothetical protein
VLIGTEWHLATNGRGGTAAAAPALASPTSGSGGGGGTAAIGAAGARPFLASAPSSASAVPSHVQLERVSRTRKVAILTGIGSVCALIQVGLTFASMDLKPFRHAAFSIGADLDGADSGLL